MYSIALERRFEAHHFLIGGDWGNENTVHAHDYKVEIRVKGNDLNEHGYLIDIIDLEKALDAVVASYDGKVLNLLQDFAGLNPSIENLARLLFYNIRTHLDTSNTHSMRVKVWESTIAWCAYEEDL
mgnify:CR=1 FL=1